MAANAVGGLTVRHRETASLIVAARHGTYHADLKTLLFQRSFPDVIVTLVDIVDLAISIKATIKIPY